MKQNMTSLKSVVTWITGSHILIAVAASAFSWSAFVQLSVEPETSLILLIGFATLFTYNVQNLLGRLADPKRDETIHKRSLTILLAASLSGVFYYLAFTGWGILKWLALPALVSILYATPVIPYRNIRIALRGVPWLKIYMILFVWLWVTAWIPYFYSHQELNTDFVLFTVQRGLFLFALLIPFDIRDLKTDYLFQRTLPQILGIRRSLHLAASSIIGYGLIVLLRFLNGSVDISILAALLLTGICTLILIGGTNESRTDLYYTGLIDSMLWLQALLLWMFMFY